MSTILVVDDHPVNRQLLTAILQPQGHTLLEAADGIEALEVGQRTPPDLVVLDVAMPRMGGLGFLEARRARAMAQDPDVVSVLTKPADPEELLSVVSMTLGADAIVSDMQMPSGDGLDLLKAVRADADLRVRLLLISSSTEPLAVGRLIEQIGTDRFVLQPIEPQHLLQALNEYFPEREGTS